MIQLVTDSSSDLPKQLFYPYNHSLDRCQRYYFIGNYGKDDFPARDSGGGDIFVFGAEICFFHFPEKAGAVNGDDSDLFTNKSAGHIGEEGHHMGGCLRGQAQAGHGQYRITGTGNIGNIPDFRWVVSLTDTITD